MMTSLLNWCSTQLRIPSWSEYWERRTGLRAELGNSPPVLAMVAVIDRSIGQTVLPQRGPASLQRAGGKPPASGAVWAPTGEWFSQGAKPENKNQAPEKFADALCFACGNCAVPGAVAAGPCSRPAALDIQP